MGWTKFFAIIFPELINLARKLFAKHGSNAEAAKLEIRNIHSQKAAIEEDRRAVDERRRRLAQMACEHPSPVKHETAEWCNLCGAFRMHESSLWLHPMDPR